MLPADGAFQAAPSTYQGPGPRPVLNDGRKTVIVILGKGEFFGEMAIARSHALLSDTTQLFDPLDARSNFEPIMQSVRDLNKLDDG